MVAIVSLIISFGLGKILNPIEFGLYGLILSFIAVNTAIFDGFGGGVSKFISEGFDAEDVKRKSLLAFFSISLIIFVFYLFFSDFIAFLLGDLNLIPYIQLTALILFFHAFFVVYQNYFNGLKLFKWQSITAISLTLFKLILVFLFIFLGFSVFGVIYGILFAYLPCLIFLFIYFRKKPVLVSFSLKKLFDFSWPLMVFSLLMVFLMSADIFFVKALSDKGVADLFTGYYTAASIISKLPYILILSISSVLFPTVSSLSSKGNKENLVQFLRKFNKFCLIAVVPLVVLISSTSEELISLLFSSSLAEGSAALSILVFGKAFFSLFLLFSSVVIAYGNSRMPLLFIIVAFICNFFLSIVLIPSYGLIGAAVASTLSMFFVFLLITGYSYKLIGKIFVLDSTFKIIFSGVLVFFISFLFPASSVFLLPKYIFLILFYLLILYFFKEFKLNDLSLLKSKLI